MASGRSWTGMTCTQCLTQQYSMRLEMNLLSLSCFDPLTNRYWFSVPTHRYTSSRSTPLAKSLPGWSVESKQKQPCGNAGLSSACYAGRGSRLHIKIIGIIGISSFFGNNRCQFIFRSGKMNCAGVASHFFKRRPAPAALAIISRKRPTRPPCRGCLLGPSGIPGATFLLSRGRECPPISPGFP